MRTADLGSILSLTWKKYSVYIYIWSIKKRKCRADSPTGTRPSMLEKKKSWYRMRTADLGSILSPTYEKKKVTYIYIVDKKIEIL